VLRSAVTLRSSSTAAAGNGSSSSSLPTGAEQGAEQTSSSRKRTRSREKKALVRQNTGLSLEGEEKPPDFRPELGIRRSSEKLNLEKEVRLDAWLEELTLEAQKLPQETDDGWTTRTGLSKGLW